MTNKEDFIEALSEGIYNIKDIVEFAEEHLQNLHSMQENIDDFERWIRE